MADLARPLIDDPASLSALERRLRERASKAIGIALEVVGAAYDRDDPRQGEVALLAIADGADVGVLDMTRCDPADLLRWLATDEAPHVIVHGAQEAISRLGVTPAKVLCTKVAATLIAEGTRKPRDYPTLAECVDALLHESLPDESLAGFSPRAEPTVRAIAKRASVLIPLMKEMTARMRNRGLARVFELECRLIAPVVAMEEAGLGVDAAQFVRIAQGWSAERREATDPDRIARLDKLISTYGYWPQEFIHGDRIRCRLHPLAADSGRFSCTDPNLQQVPSEHTAPGLRACFVPPADHRLIIADYSQIELRVAAHLAPCEALRSVFREGRDPHRATAATISGKPEAEITDRERKLAKAVNFGFLFGMGPARFRSYAKDSFGVDLTEAEARRSKEAFLDTFPGIAAWHRKVGAMSRRGEAVTVRTALGRRKRFSAEKFSFNAALNIPVQGTAADGFKLAMVALHDALPPLGARGVLCVHDEYIAEAPTPKAEEARELVARHMKNAMATLVDSIPIEVEASIASSWADCG